MSKILLGVFMVALCSGIALSFSNPVRYVFDRTNPSCAVASFDIGLRASGSPSLEVISSLPPDRTNFLVDFTGYQDGLYFVAVRACGMDGTVSGWSNEVETCVLKDGLQPPSGCRQQDVENGG